MQRHGWKPEEILAGLAAVLPRNVFLYVAKMPNLRGSGRLRPAGRHAAQPGGRQGAGRLHRAALRGQGRAGRRSSCTSTAARPGRSARRSRPSASAAAATGRVHRPRRGQEITYTSNRSDDTRCHFCKNECVRTFIDVSSARTADEPRASKIEILPGVKRLIVATVREGARRGRRAMRDIKKGVDQNRELYPNLVALAAREVFARRGPGRRRPADRARSPRASAGATRRPRSATRCASASRGCSTSTRCPFFTGYLEASASRRRTSCSRTSRAWRCTGRGHARRDRSVLPVQGRHGARPQPAVQAPHQAAARLHLLPDDRRAALALSRTQGEHACPTVSVTPRGREGGLHQGRRPVRRDGRDAT